MNCVLFGNMDIKLQLKKQNIKKWEPLFCKLSDEILPKMHGQFFLNPKPSIYFGIFYRVAVWQCHVFSMLHNPKTKQKVNSKIKAFH